jgi:hypothetical protein
MKKRKKRKKVTILIKKGRKRTYEYKGKIGRKILNLFLKQHYSKDKRVHKK